ncbi:hypothetical protein [Nocardiopsis dassonvillei]|uniref:hypothetical protein n=1 Tax=Nocardiopsis dassonvillei TaxID=2014 RepID=UPI0036422E68
MTPTPPAQTKTRPTTTPPAPTPTDTERRLVVAGILRGDRRLVITSLPATLRALA